MLNPLMKYYKNYVYITNWNKSLSIVNSYRSENNLSVGFFKKEIRIWVPVPVCKLKNISRKYSCILYKDFKLIILMFRFDYIFKNKIIPSPLCFISISLYAIWGKWGGYRVWKNDSL